MLRRHRRWRAEPGGRGGENIPHRAGVAAGNAVATGMYCISQIRRHTVYGPSVSTLLIKRKLLHTPQVHCSARVRLTVYSYTLRSTPTLADSRLTLSFLRRSELYEKGADWVNERYETTVNATSLWVDEYAESGRSKKRVTVDMCGDVSDPYSCPLYTSDDADE